MTAVATIPAGAFCWAELTTTDKPAAKRFYAKLFGWNADDTPIGGGETYTIFDIGGKSVGAAYQPSATAQGDGTMPPTWRAYVSVPNVDALIAKTAALGGTALMPAMDVMDAGRMTMVQDPSGGILALWQANQHQGMDLAGQVNTVCWYELLTRDLAKARAFYGGLLGWIMEDQPMGPMTYTVIKNRDQQIGGMMQIQPEWGNMPSAWRIYFAVADCDRTADTARKLGGTIETPPTDIPGIGRFASLKDPQGAAFSIIRMQMPS